MSDYSRSSTTTHKVLYALPAFVLAFPTIPVFVLLPTFYGEDLGLGLTTVGTILFALRVLDVISDPVIGWISDAVPFKWGKRKLPIVIGALVGAPALYFLFSPPDQPTALYLVFWGGLLYLGWTAIQIPYQAWAAELEPDYGERTRLNGFREFSGLCGLLFIGGLGITLSDMTVSDQYLTTAIVTIIAGIICLGAALMVAPRGRVALKTTSFTMPLENKLFLRVLGAWFMNGLANGLPAVCLPLYLMHILKGSDEDRALLLFVYFLFGILGIPVWLKLAQHWSKHHIWCLSMLFACVIFAFVPFLSSGDILAFGVVCALTGLCLGSDLALPPSIQADCADWDRYRFKKERLASLFAYWSMATKLALGMAVGLAFPVLEWSGLEAGSELSKNMLIVIYAGVPIVLKISAVALMWRFPLSREKHLCVQHFLEKTG